MQPLEAFPQVILGQPSSLPSTTTSKHASNSSDERILHLRSVRQGRRDHVRSLRPPRAPPRAIRIPANSLLSGQLPKDGPVKPTQDDQLVVRRVPLGRNRPLVPKHGGLGGGDDADEPGFRLGSSTDSSSRPRRVITPSPSLACSTLLASTSGASLPTPLLASLAL